MTPTPCMCTFDRCNHEQGKHCGDPVTAVKFTVESENRPEIRIGICDKCWETFKKHFPSFVPS